jgi:preprotein translocase subunit SecF
MYIVRHRTLFFWITGLFLVVAIAAIVIYGLPLGIDFTGGSLEQVNYPAGRPALATIQQEAASIPLGAITVLNSGTSSVSVRTRNLTPDEHTSLLSALSAHASTTELAFTSVGPALGAQFANKALWALLAVALVIILYIAWAFRKVSKPVPSWGYGVAVVAMLAIDLIVPTGFYAILCHFTGAQVDSLFIVALLALLGYCVNDVIVIFDRIREHLARNERTGHHESFEETIGKSIDETMRRSINTALTVALALLALIFLGAPATQDFALVILVGVVIGTFSSICRSAPLLIPLAKWIGKNK